jgi:alcohol dehydrogenase (cytochrome c)/quinohemoprotein ethanol dehydrogenase
VLVYKIGGSDSLPPAQDFAPEIDPPRQFTTADAINSGRLTYARYCSGCHGDTAVAGGPIPDIRSTYALHDPEDWNEIILEGALSDLGMVSFKDVLSEDDAQNIRAYVIDRAIKSIAQP